MYAHVHKSFSLLFYEISNLKVSVRRDLTAQAMCDTIWQFSHDPQIASASCSAVAILTHGAEGDVLFGNDRQTEVVEPNSERSHRLTVKLICDLLTDEDSLLRSGKPKILIIQACRGSMHFP